jgi:hypothetical protein
MFNHKSYLVSVAAVLAAAILALAACTEPEPTSTPIEPPPELGLAPDEGTGEPMPIEPEILPLMTQTAPATDFEEALLTGILETDMNGCWRVAQAEGTSFAIIWPFGFTATAMIGAPQVLNENGEVVGTAGMEISLGGGAREGDAAAGFEADHPDLPSDACPGPYWVVGEVALQQ